MTGLLTHIQPSEILQPPPQKKVSQKPLEEDLNETDDVNTTTVDWTVSEDYDVSNAKTKPAPRQSVQPTYRGWKEVGRWEKSDALHADEEAVDLLSSGSVFDTFLPSVAYGDWYHNAGYLVVGGLLSWIIGWFRFSLAPVFVVMVASAIMYRSSVRKYRQHLRDEAQREFTIKSIETDYETMDWLNVFLEKFWHFLEPSIAQIVTDQVNPILAASPAPAFIKSLWLDSFTAGTKPPRIDMVKSLGNTADDVIVMDWGCSFTPNELADSSNKQMKNNVNQKVVVKANIFGITVPIAVSDISFKCLLRVRLRMTSAFPHIETVNVSLLEAPQFDFNCRLLALSAWEVLAFPGLYPFINQMVKKYAGPMLFTPLSFQLNVQQLMAGCALNSAIGVLAIDVKAASGLKNYGRRDNTIDPYCNLGFSKTVLATTKTIQNTGKPVWNQKLYIPISSTSEPLNISIMDANYHRKDQQIGSVQFDLDVLNHNPKNASITAPVIRNNKPVGEFQFGYHFTPTLIPQMEPDGAIVPPPDLNTGIVRIEVGEARNLKGKDEKPLATYAEVFLDGKSFIKTSVVKKNNSPRWGTAKENIIFNCAKSKVKVVLKTADDKTYGIIITSLKDLIDATQVENPWFQFGRGGEIRLSTTWKSVRLEGASGAGGYTNPIGVLRVLVEKSEDLRNLETVGKVDPYARLLVNGIQRARTAAVESTLDPTWNEIHYISVSSPNQKLTLEVMDVENIRPDRTLGSVDVNLRELINKDEKGKYIECVDNTKRVSKLIHKRGPKGSITYTLSFYPALAVMSLEEIQEEEEERMAEEAKKAKAAEEEAAGEKKPDVKKTEGDDEDDDDIEAHQTNKLKLSLEELLEYNSGVLVYEFLEVNTSKTDTYLQIFADNHGLADFTSPELKQRTKKVHYTGDVTIKELEWSKINFRIAKKRENNRAEKPISEVTIPALQILKNGYHTTTTINLDAESSVTLRASWIPILYVNGIPPMDTKDNYGYLNVTAVSANDLPAGDSNGKSDPYIKFYLNTDKDSFFKSKKVKKTLDPVWNESSSVAVVNKHDSTLTVKCFDWDVGPDQDDFLCSGIIKLSDVSKDGETEFDVELFDERDQKAGVAHLKASFKPDFVLNVRPGSSTHIGDAFGTGVGAVGSVGKGVGKGLGKGVGTVGKGLKKGLHFGKSSKDD